MTYSKKLKFKNKNCISSQVSFGKSYLQAIHNNSIAGDVPKIFRELPEDRRMI